MAYQSGVRLNDMLQRMSTPPIATMLMASAVALLLVYPRVRTPRAGHQTIEAGGNHAFFWTQPVEARPCVGSHRRSRSNHRRHGGFIGSSKARGYGDRGRRTP